MTKNECVTLATEPCSRAHALQDRELLTEGQVFEKKAAARVEKTEEDHKKDDSVIFMRCWGIEFCRSR